MPEVPEKTKFFQRRPTVEVVLFTTPTTGLLVAGWMLFASPIRLLGWAFVGVAGLIGALRSGQNNSKRFHVVIWPRKQMGIVVTTIAYNGVLFPSIAMAEVAWGGTGSPAVGVLLALLIPIWFLKHIAFVLTRPTRATR